MSRVVVTGRIPETALENLRANHDVIAWESEGSISREELLRRVAGADAIVSLLTERVDAELLDAAGPQLKVVSNVAVGYDNIDVPACTERGIIATNTPGVLTEATADIAFGLILMATRRLGEGERLIRAGQPWKWGMFFLLGSSLQGKTLGIVGMGGIGIATARRAKAFGMEIVYQSRSEIDPAIADELGARRVELDELLAVSDVVSLHCPYGPNTHHLIGAEQLAAMKDTAYLVNTARGPIIDEAALALALRENQIAGAGLDVFEQEPKVHPWLLELENVALVPHLGSATVETRTAMAVLAATNTLAVLGGEQPPTPING
ncbi:D-glycerate dehydrogenase [Arthrobacter sp. TES]|uniref:D-glycerate dehydrogenase n=1 Tax=Paenarthrobacter ureafaciens TaxID=37931 RepID=A0AAX3EIH2_PAEUR|nr:MULTISPECIES: D-glycerate dehydrogenase [Paenarthrobacter]AOY73205.1 glyoxylate reductase [Arthrobacter sp. ZXY-2]ERI38961.1 glyoxylate reductase [Arthrobacter sp. AK-YN10]NKR13029.1 D-glycerate dehydrogenase [Arthrobacter sp. M5]NKR16764.1 D-glycerate dehydrogenase [Arthrobacter sp. M6]OEH59847.1 D-glycerate dehydrogenase [Arthrobacter sp. D4]OEH60007.1 D-glycerate dehydrogenase [Arthrobacter sp. D2]QOI64767.1 D-glycerate dehydrogenase [Arthrobacter sp. TES]